MNMTLIEQSKRKFTTKQCEVILMFFARKNLRFVVFINSCNLENLNFVGSAKRAIAWMKIYILHRKQVNKKNLTA